MKINHNMSATIANNQLLRNENGLSKSIERLSSGLRINHAKDDAAGMAISTKMKAQIKGLDQASQNASDGNSLLDTADGALNEVTNMIQRMRELSVQAANGTNTPDDLKALQSEIVSLTDEIDRVSRDTEFNTKSLLNGTLDQRVYSNVKSISRIEISDAVSAKEYGFTVKEDARQAVLVGDNSIGSAVVPGTISINGSEVTIDAGDSMSTVYEKIRTAAEFGGVTVFSIVPGSPAATDGSNEDYAGYSPDTFGAGNELVFVSNEFGSSAELDIKCDPASFANFLGFPTSAQGQGHNAVIDTSGPTLGNNFSETATVSCNGKYATITDRNGFKMTFEIEVGTATTIFGDPKASASGPPLVNSSISKGVEFDVTNIGTLTLQIGANENQTMDIRIPEVSAKSLYIDKVDVSVIGGADKAIDAFDNALYKVSEARSRIGSYQNRLEYTVASLDAGSINTTSALSRIEDLDMAKEMSEFTKFNVLTQAATSVLAQANDIPQQTLQLLQ